MNLRVYLVALLLIIVSATLVHYRIKLFGVSLTPTMVATQWQIEAVVTGEAATSRARIELELPSRNSFTNIIQESFSASDLTFAILETEGLRRAVWSGRELSSNSLQARYQVFASSTDRSATPNKNMRAASSALLKIKEERLELATPVINQLRRDNRKPDQLMQAIVNDYNSSDSKLRQALNITDRSSLEFQARSLGAVLIKSGFEVVSRKGILVGLPERSTPFHYWLQVLTSQGWQDVFIQPIPSGKTLIPWGRSSDNPLKTEGLNNASLQISVSPMAKDIADLRKAREDTGAFWRIISLDTLPVSTQAVYRLMLLIPIGAFILAILRSVVGVRTFGTFMPVLIALSFREMDVMWGVGLFSFVVFCGLFFRALFSKLQLLLVPRLAATLTVVILIVLAAGVIAFDAGYEQVLTVTLFPIVIITMTVERMSLIWEESGAKEAIVRFSYSLLCAVVLYELIFGVYLEYLVFTFPELLLSLLALMLVLGRYTGYRLTELYRFRSFGK